MAGQALLLLREAVFSQREWLVWTSAVLVGSAVALQRVAAARIGRGSTGTATVGAAPSGLMALTSATVVLACVATVLCVFGV
jgi:hypothetical protein